MRRAQAGLTGVAAPIFGPDEDTKQRLVAAVGVSGPTARLAGRIEDLGRLLIHQAQALSELLHHGTHKEGAA